MDKSFPRVVIVGAGISGLCLAIKLKQAGMTSFTVLEKSQDVGGTWLENTYPGSGCDIPSILYCYSFAPKYDWSRKYAPQPEILEYFRRCADKFGIREHIRFGTAVSSATFDESSQTWRILTEQGKEIEADVFVSAVGQLNRPKVPVVEGQDTFQGPAFHSARWKHDFEVQDRVVGVLGTGASAIQLVPRIAESARKVLIFQRSPNWISRRHDYRYPGILRAALRWIPGLGKLQRFWIYGICEARILLYKRRTWLNKGFTGWLKYRMGRKLPPELRNTVIPKYPAGCKRVLVSNDYLETLRRENVQIITAPIRQITSDGILAGNDQWPLDAIVYATGFESNQFLSPMRIVGREGLALEDAWKERPRTYLGIMCAKFPNFFMLYGPNTNLGHNSIIFMVECQVDYLLRCLKMMRKQQIASLEIRPEVVDAFDHELQAGLDEKVWNGYVSNWYKTAQGHIVNNWSGPTLSYWRKTRRPDPEQFLRASADDPTAIGGPKRAESA